MRLGTVMPHTMQERDEPKAAKYPFWWRKNNCASFSYRYDVYFFEGEKNFLSKMAHKTSSSIDVTVYP